MVWILKLRGTVVRLQCLKSAIHQHQAAKTSSAIMREDLSLLKKTAEILMVFVIYEGEKASLYWTFIVYSFKNKYNIVFLYCWKKNPEMCDSRTSSKIVIILHQHPFKELLSLLIVAAI